MDHCKVTESLLAWFGREARDLPWRRTRDPYAIWVSEIMLQQTQVKTVLPYWQRWMRALPNVKALAEAHPETIHKLWEGLGYYTRVRNMQKAAQVILEEHGGQFPQRFEEVLALPGIGRYTAGAICSIAFDQPQPILDGNVMRVLTRLCGIEGDPRDKAVNARLWQLAQELVQTAANLGRSTCNPVHVSRFTPHPTACSHLNQSLMELGALICTPRQAQCAICPVASFCQAYQQGRVDELPQLSPRAAATPRRFLAFVASKEGRFLVRQRPAGVVNGHLWEFPNVEVALQHKDPQAAARQSLGTAKAELEPLCSIKHTITRYRITLEVFRVLNDGVKAPAGHWLTAAQLAKRPFTSAHKKILQRLGLK